MRPIDYLTLALLLREAEATVRMDKDETINLGIQKEGES